MLQNRLELVEAYKSFVKPDSPLMIPLYRKDGTLLAPKNKELTQEQTTRLLLNVELYTPRAQLLKALEKISIISNEKGTDVAFSIHSPFLRTKKLIEELKTVRETYSDSFFIQILAISSRIQNVCKTNANQAIAQCITNQTLEPAYVQPVLCAILIYQMTSYLEWKSSEID
ncbi:MAG: hypothetical protein R3240_07100, partial [Gammaproteobacteria bacterium]|nr:hypothetical protein [Gammaproteobacteria bacterium]